MYFSIKPNKDTTITNLQIRGRSFSGSNSGQSEILELYALTESRSRVGYSRALIQFDLSELSQSIAEGTIPSSSVQYNLRLKNANHAQTVPYSYDIKVFPLSQSFDEGRGLAMEDEDLKDQGFANWAQATRTQNWGVPGGSYISEPNLTASQHFDFGTEDLNVDISNIVQSWIDGTIENHGLILKYEDSQETGSSDLYVKKFFSRHALAAERPPKIECLWEKVLQDDRSELAYNATGSLFYYRFAGGSPNHISSPIYVDILNSSSVAVQTLTSSVVENGVYQISGVFLTPDTETEIYRDVWFTDAEQLFTGTIAPVYATGSQFLEDCPISIGLPDMKSSYSEDERVCINVFAKMKDYRPAIATIANTAPDPLLLKEAFYQIENAENEEVIIPFSTGSVQFSKLSYDANGNYFDLWTKALPKGLYKIKILANYNNNEIVFDNNWIFKVA